MRGILDDLLEQWPEGPIPDRPVTGHRCDECDETDRLIGGRTWRDVAIDFPDYCHDVFPLLTEPAKNYYLPAFMYAAISKGNGQSTSVEYYLLSDDFHSSAFTKRQLSLVKHWVQAALVGNSDPGNLATIFGKLS